MKPNSISDRIEHVEDDQVVATEPQRRHRIEDRFGLVIEVRNDDEDAATPEVLRQFVQRPFQVPGAPGLQAIQHVQHRLHVLGGRRHVLDDGVVKGDEPDAVALMVHEVGQTRREDARVFELGDAAAAVVHRLRHVHQHREVHVRLGFVLLDVVAIRPRPQPPVHAADVVARHIAAVLGEVHGGAEVRRLVKPVDETVRDRP